MRNEPLVQILEDDKVFAQSLAFLLSTDSIRSQVFGTSDALLSNANLAACRCLILDLRLAAESGIDAFIKLLDRGHTLLPVIFLTGSPDTESTVKSMKLGAFDFLEKPLAPSILLKKVREAFQESDRRRQAFAAQGDHLRVSELTSREVQVMQLLCEGMSSKQIARRLRISAHTVGHHRAHLLSKTQVSSTAELIRRATLMRMQ